MGDNRYNYDLQQYRVRMAIQEVAEKHNLSKDQVNEIYQSMIDSTIEAIKTTTYEEYEDVNVILIPYIGKFTTTPRLYRNYKKKLSNLKKKKDESSESNGSERAE